MGYAPRRSSPMRLNLPRPQARAGLCLLLLCLPVACVAASASSLFESLRARVFQVRVIDIASGDKSTIGSGFRVDAAGLVATNFHVVSLLLDKPARYRLELLGHDGVALPASVAAFDVLHDVAIIRGRNAGGEPLMLAAEPPLQGERIYSMGNPEDLGMTIIEGNYNGLIAASRFERMLFSGSLNPGMSGGPAFDDAGSVVGVNVATGGEQLGFLVPVSYVRALLARAREGKAPGEPKAAIGEALLTDSNAFHDQLLHADWKHGSFGDLELPRDLSPSLKCWGQHFDNEDTGYARIQQNCQSQEYLYLGEDFYTGDLAYTYEWLTAGSLNRFQFYTAVTRRFTHSAPDNAEDEEQVTNFACTTDFVRLAGTPWKASICLRRYRDFPALHDATLALASLHSNHEAAIVRMTVTGIERDRALALFRKTMDAIAWKP